MAEGRSHPRGEQFQALNSQLSQAVGNFTQLLSSASAFGQAINQFRTLETQLALTNAAAGGTVITFQRMAEASRQFALATTSSAQESASALFYLAQAGYTVEQSINALAGVMVLAQATMQDVAFTSDLIASTLKTYNLTSLDSTRIANLFAAAQVNSLASLDKLAFSLRQVGPVASAMGQEIETTTAFLNELYNVGLRGEQAGTALRNVMVRLAKPVGEAADVLNKYGIATTTASGQARALEDVLLDLANANLSTSEAVAIAGVEALSGFLALTKSVQTGAFDAQRDAITGTTAAFEMAIQQIDTLDGSLKRAKNAINDVFISLGEEIAPIIREVADGVRDLVLWFNSLDGDTRNMIVTIGLAAAGITAFAAAWRTVSFVLGPVSGALGAVVGAAGKADGAARKVGLLSQAFTALRTVMTYVFAGGLVTNLMQIGNAVSGAVPIVGRLTGALQGLGLVRFGPLLAAIGGVTAAIGIGVGVGLVYAIYKVTSAWNEANRASAEAIAQQRARLLEAAALSPNMFPEIQGRQRQNEMAFEQAQMMPTAESATLIQGIIRRNENDQKQIAEAKASFEAVAGGWDELGKSLADVRKTRDALTGMRDGQQVSLADAFNFTDPLMGENGEGIKLLRDELARSEDFQSSITNLIEQQYSQDNISAVQQAATSAGQRKDKYDAEIAKFLAAGGDKESQEFKDIAGLRDESARAEKEALATLDRLIAGIENDEVIKRLPELGAAREELEAALAKVTSADSSGGSEVTRAEANYLRLAQNRYKQAIEGVSSLVDAEITAAQQTLGELQKLGEDSSGQVERAKLALVQLANRLVLDITGGEYPIQEFFGGQSESIVEFFKTYADQTQPIIQQQLLEGQQVGRDMLVDTINRLQESGVAVPQEILDYIRATSPAGVLATAFNQMRADLVLEAAQAKNEMDLTMAEISQSLSGGIKAEQNKVALEAVEDFVDLNADLEEKFADAFGDINYEGMAIEIDRAKAEALGVADTLAAFADETGEAFTGTIGQLLDFDSVMAPVYEAIKTGDANAIATAAQEAAAQWDAQVQAAIAIMQEQLGLSGEEVAGLQALKDWLGAKLGAIMTPLVPEIGDVTTSDSVKNKYNRPARKGGKSPADEARKLKEDFEKELRQVQRDVLELERDILQYDNTIDFSARFSAMIDIDRREIAMKYDQRIQELKSDIDAANAKFAKNPVYLGQLVTGYNELIGQLERAKQAELDYTNSFTYQSQVRNEAIDRQIEAMRNLSMEGERTGKAILDGMKAGLLLYQKDLKTTVDNVAKATTGVLDGLAEAVGAFVTGQGDAMDILRNAILGSLNELVVNATKRMLQTAFAGLTGGDITGGITGTDKNPVDADPVKVALSTAGQQTQVVYTNHLTQMQGIFTNFATSFNAALNNVVTSIGGAGGTVAGVLPAPVSASMNATGAAMNTAVAAINQFSTDTVNFLKSVSTGGATRVDAITNLNTSFATSLEGLIKEANSVFGQGAVQVTSAFRSNARQAELWAEALKKYGSPEAARKWVAPPGSSNHNFGLAADLGYNAPGVKDWMHQNAGKYGLNYRMSNEDWHIEPQNAMAMRGGAPMAQPVVDPAVTAEVQAFKTATTESKAALTEFTSALKGQNQPGAGQGAAGGPVPTTPVVPVGGPVPMTAPVPGMGGQEAMQMQQVYMQFLQQLQMVLQQFIQQFSAVAQQAGAAGGVPGAGGIPLGGTAPAGGAAPATGGAGAMGGMMENAMGGFMSMFQNLLGSLGGMLQSLFSSLLGSLGGAGGLFGGLFDSGGSLPRGKWGIAGEFGPEIIKGPAKVVGREDTMRMFRNSAERSQPAPQAVPAINNIIVQDQSVVNRYLSTSAGRRQIANIVRQTQNPAG